MNKKIGVVVTSVLFVLVFCIVWFVFLKPTAEVDPNEPTDTLVTPPTSTPGPEPTEKPSVEPTEEPEVDRTFELDDNVTVRITGEDYVEDGKEEEVFTPVEIAYGLKVDEYTFSNGFYLIGNNNVCVEGVGVGEGVCSGVEPGDKIRVKEHDAISTTIEDLREEYIRSYAFYRYLEAGGYHVPKSAEVVEEVGLTGWEDEFPQLEEDPTIEQNYQIIADFEDECAFGRILFCNVYSIADGVYTAKGFIVCDRDRVLEVTVSTSDLSRCWSYMIEMTNNVIKIIE